LQVDSYEERAIALEKIIQVVKSYIRSSLSSPSSDTSPTLSDHSNTVVTDQQHQIITSNEDDEYSKQLFYYLLTILRLSISCPYSDVRQTFKELLIGLKVIGVKKFLFHALKILNCINRKLHRYLFQKQNINHLLILFLFMIYFHWNQIHHQHMKQQLLIQDHLIYLFLHGHIQIH
jgi:hypothetical protein